MSEPDSKIRLEFALQHIKVLEHRVNDQQQHVSDLRATIRDLIEQRDKKDRDRKNPAQAKPAG